MWKRAPPSLTQIHELPTRIGFITFHHACHNPSDNYDKKLHTEQWSAGVHSPPAAEILLPVTRDLVARVQCVIGLPMGERIAVTGKEMSTDEPVALRNK